MRLDSILRASVLLFVSAHEIMERRRCSARSIFLLMSKVFITNEKKSDLPLPPFGMSKSETGKKGRSRNSMALMFFTRRFMICERESRPVGERN